MPKPPRHAALQALPVLLAIALATLALSACGGGNKPPVSTGASTPAPGSATPTLLDQIKALEASGQLPQLDRSSSIPGPDANHNGVRDDIEAWIAALPITDRQKKAVLQDARTNQKMLLVDLTDKAALQALGDEGAASIVCIGDVFMPNYQDGHKLSAKIEALTANTKERARRYLDYNRARSGSVTRLPDGNTCEE